MAAVSGSTASAFPNRLDPFPRLRNGTGLDSVVSANLWNKMLSASYRLEVHNQYIVRAGGEEGTPPSRKRVFKTQTYNNSGLISGFSVTFTLTDAEMRFLGNNPFRNGNLILTDAYALTGAAVGLYYTTIHYPNGPFVDPTSINVNVTRQEPELRSTASVPAGDFQISLTIIGL